MCWKDGNIVNLCLQVVDRGLCVALAHRRGRKLRRKLIQPRVDQSYKGTTTRNVLCTVEILILVQTMEVSICLLYRLTMHCLIVHGNHRQQSKQWLTGLYIGVPDYDIGSNSSIP